MVDVTQRAVVVPLVVARENESNFTVETLLASIQKGVRETRKSNPELEVYHLHDVSLRLKERALVADLCFRR